MEVYRISAKKYSTKLTASGSANRWNKDREFVIYTGSSRSLSTLELVVHRASIKPTIDYKVMVLYLPNEDKFYKSILKKELPNKWRTTAEYSNLQKMGSDWYTNQDSLILKVPSAVIPQEYNFIINTTHPDFNKVQIVEIENYFWDSRLL